MPNENHGSYNDEELMLKYRDGDAQAFELLYNRHKGPLYRFMLRQCGNPGISEELFHDVWLNIIRARENYSVQAKFTTYLYRIAHNRLIDYYRKQANGLPVSFTDDSPSLEEHSDSPNVQPENKIVTEQTTEHLMQQIDKLPEAQRETFLLHEESGLNLDEIASITHVSKEAAKSRLRYAVKKLKQAMGDHR